jgi:hypothetical protein
MTYEKVAQGVGRLVAALDALPGIHVHGSSAGGGGASNFAIQFSVSFDVDPDAGGWRSLETIAAAAGSTMRGHALQLHIDTEHVHFQRALNEVNDEQGLSPNQQLAGPGGGGVVLTFELRSIAAMDSHDVMSGLPEAVAAALEPTAGEAGGPTPSPPSEER